MKVIRKKWLRKEVTSMRLAALLNNRYSEIENRKRMLKQKTADEAYKKMRSFSNRCRIQHSMN